MSEPAPERGATVIEYTDYAGTLIYFDVAHWVDEVLPRERTHAGRYLWTGEKITVTGDHRNGGYSVDYGGGEGIWYAWREVVLRPDELEYTKVVGLPQATDPPVSDAAEPR